MRAVSVRVNEVIGVAGYVLPGARRRIATQSPTSRHEDMTSKVVITNAQVLAAGTKLEQDDRGKPMPVSVVTLLVSPQESERLALSGEGHLQLALRNPLDASAPPTPGIRPAAMLGTAAPQPAVRAAAVRTKPAVVVATVQPEPEPLPTVEIIRGDKRAREVVK
jgi:pilus assembly protein CpaB